MSASNIILGHLTEKKKRHSTHNSRVTQLIGGLSKRANKIQGNVPKIFLKKEQIEHDLIVVEGRNVWNDDMDRYVREDFPNVAKEIHDSEIHLYLPVEDEGLILKGLWKDLFALLSLIVLCACLLYYLF